MVINFEYDPEVDAGYLQLREATVDYTIDLEQTALKLPILADIDANGLLIGFEILNVSKTVPGLER